MHAGTRAGRGGGGVVMELVALGVAVVLIAFAVSFVLALLLVAAYFLVEAIAKWIGNKVADWLGGSPRW